MHVECLLLPSMWKENDDRHLLLRAIFVLEDADLFPFDFDHMVLQL